MSDSSGAVCPIPARLSGFRDFGTGARRGSCLPIQLGQAPSASAMSSHRVAGHTPAATSSGTARSGSARNQLIAAAIASHVRRPVVLGFPSTGRQGPGMRRVHDLQRRRGVRRRLCRSRPGEDDPRSAGLPTSLVAASYCPLRTPAGRAAKGSRIGTGPRRHLGDAPGVLGGSMPVLCACGQRRGGREDTHTSLN